MTPIRVRGASLAAELLTRDPSLTTWSRLESIPATADLTSGLQALVADPLWLLGRQWQFMEFNGEDAGSPIDVRLEVETASIQRYRAGRLPDHDAADAARDYQHLNVPLEVMVEQEPVRRNHLRMRLEAGLHFLACLSAENVSGAARLYLRSERFRLVMPPPTEPAVDALGAGLRDLAGDTALDGELLAVSFRTNLDDSGELTNLPRTPRIPAAQRDGVLRAARRWLQWYDSSVVEPGQDSDAWIPSRLEYGLALSAELEEGPVVLVADEYSNGRLDWFSFRAATGPSLGRPAAPVPAVVTNLPAMIPSPVRYPGMPASRYWEFEDRRVNLAQLDASRTDLTRLLLIEFGLAYGDDWFVIPVDLPVGTVARIRRCVVRDTFGEETNVEASRNADGSRWSLFQLATDADAPAYLRDLMFLPPTLPSVLMSEPVEAVALGRDEMANLVWGTERAVQGVAGDRVDRFREASTDAMYQALPDPPPDASLIYRLASPVPRYQIPFVPVRTEDTVRGTIRLERRALLRFVEGQDDPETVHPRGVLLRSQPIAPVDEEPALQIEEEEVPREGVVVERAFQYTRWLNGSSFLWVGRRKRAGDGLASVGFVSDALQRKP
ncbi:MAG TPA: hypothetical protein VFZ73_18640 [Gemmatimonadaceae bacterium]